MRAMVVMLMAMAAYGADAEVVAKGAAEERKACVGCHSARISATQRLSRAGWEKELDKMVRWGAKITEREALLVYLVDKYGDDKAAEPLPRSADGVGR